MAAPKGILLIDDEVDLLEMIKFQLEAKGFQVTTASNGQEGLERLKTLSPDLIILDMNMPKMGGIEFYKNICDANSKPRYPVLILTARANLEKIFEDLLVEGFMPKPFDIHELIAKVEAITQKQKSKPESPGAGNRNSSVSPQSNLSITEEAVLNKNMMDVDHEGRSLDAAAAKDDGKISRTERAVRTGQDKKEIIILENDPLVAAALKTVLTVLNCSPRVTANFEECFDSAVHSYPDLILLKHFVNSANTEELAVRLKEMPRFYQTPVVIYDTIGERLEKIKSADCKEIAFTLNSEGNRMIQKIKRLLEL